MRPELWSLWYTEIESWSSWGGTGANPPGSPGCVPAIYDSGDSVQDNDIVLWYIAHISSLHRVTACGRWFKLEGFPEPEYEPGDHDHTHDHNDTGGAGHDHG